jgi:hypothetical protein
VLNLLVGEDTIQSLLCFKRRVSGTVTGSPVWTPSSNVVLSSGQYIDLNYIPSSDGVVMTGTDQMIGVGVVGMGVLTSAYAMGATTTGSQGIRVNPLVSTAGSTVQRFQGQAGFANETADGAFIGATVTGLFGVQKSPTTGARFYSNGTAVASAGATPSTSLTNRSIVVGGNNTNGTVNGFRPGTYRIAFAGASLTTDEWVAFVAATNALYAAIALE